MDGTLVVVERIFGGEELHSEVVVPPPFAIPLSSSSPSSEEISSMLVSGISSNSSSLLSVKVSSIFGFFVVVVEGVCAFQGLVDSCEAIL